MQIREPTAVERLIAALTAGLRAADVPFMIIGGQAVLVHGAPRVTEDIDISLAAAPARLAEILRVCEAVGLRPLPADVSRFVAETFVLPARHALSAFRVDLIFTNTGYEREAIRRAMRVEIAGASVPFATAEDLLIHKLFAGRPRDVEDARGVVRRQGDAIDWTYVERWARAFAEIPGREGMPAMVADLRRNAADR